MKIIFNFRQDSIIKIKINNFNLNLLCFINKINKIKNNENYQKIMNNIKINAWIISNQQLLKFIKKIIISSQLFLKYIKLLNQKFLINSIVLAAILLKMKFNNIHLIRINNINKKINLLCLNY